MTRVQLDVSELKERQKACTSRATHDIYTYMLENADKMHTQGARVAMKLLLAGSSKKDLKASADSLLVSHNKDTRIKSLTVSLLSFKLKALVAYKLELENAQNALEQYFEHVMEKTFNDDGKWDWKGLDAMIRDVAGEKPEEMEL